MDIIKIFNQQNIMINLIIFFLITMSLISWYLIFYKILILRKDRKNFQINNLNFTKQIINSKNWFEDLKKIDIPHGSLSSIETILHKALSLKTTLESFDSHEAKKEILTMHLIQCLDQIRFWLDRGLTGLASIGSSAPFIGLLGTVIGIYDALQNIASHGNANLNTVSGPISEALIVTAIGLFVAIPAVLAYNFFVRVNRIHIQNLRHFAEQITIYLSNQTSKNKS